MTSRTETVVAPPAWGDLLEDTGRQTRRAGRGGGHVARAPAGRPDTSPRFRVRGPRWWDGAAGAALAGGFALLWAFLLLGVVAPAAGLR